MSMVVLFRESLRNITVITAKEIKLYFFTPAAYVVLISFICIANIWFYYIHNFFAMDIASMRSYFSVMPLLIAVLVPAVTMRVWAEENSSGTLEILLSLPFREIELVLGKFFGAYVIFLTAAALTVPVPLSVIMMGNFDVGQIIAEYIGLVLLGSTATAVGCAASIMVKNQVSAFLISAIILLFLIYAGEIQAFIGLPASIQQLFRNLSLEYHFSSMVKGVIDTRSISFFLISTIGFLYINIKILVYRRWV